MAIISAAIVSSRTCAVSRQFVSITRLRMEGLITAFQRLVENSESETKDHTFIETDSVRYVYSPLDQLYLVIITSLDSNILEDLDTIRLLQSAVQDVCPDHVDESAVLSKAFDIIFAFDEVVSFGQREAVTLAQIRQYVEMDSVEEKLQKIVRNMKERWSRGHFQTQGGESQDEEEGSRTGQPTSRGGRPQDGGIAAEGLLFVVGAVDSSAEQPSSAGLHATAAGSDRGARPRGQRPPKGFAAGDETRCDCAALQAMMCMCVERLIISQFSISV